MSDLSAQLQTLEQEAVASVQAAPDMSSLEEIRVGVLGKKGSLTRLLRGMADVAPAERKAVGMAVNEAKQRIADALAVRGDTLREQERAARLAGPQLDVTLPAWSEPRGSMHPITRTMEDMCSILGSMGFELAEGPDVEDDYHNFEALNIPPDHPARDMQDTFFVEGNHVLRTHTSPVQIRVMELQKPPIRVIAPGSVYRHDDDVTHSPMFHQVEGLLVDKGITFGHLKGVLTSFLQAIFERDLPVKFRPSYFPFTEPSAEVDIGCVMCGGPDSAESAGCRICKGTGWLEILGSGMVHPAVLGHVGIDPEEYTGFAFGLGVERIAMLKYRIDDIRLFYGGDLRFLNQF